jgi:radical SAM protein with 4Fe4S-binding SPASM domain
VAIGPYGDVFSCVQARVAAGNLREQSLQAIWQTSPVWNDLRRLTLNELPVCRTCELRTLCVRCHGLALVEDGDLRAPASVNCREALARRQVLVEKGALPADYPIPAHLREQGDVPVALHVLSNNGRASAHNHVVSETVEVDDFITDGIPPC